MSNKSKLRESACKHLKPISKNRYLYNFYFYLRFTHPCFRVEVPHRNIAFRQTAIIRNKRLHPELYGSYETTSSLSLEGQQDVVYERLSVKRKENTYYTFTHLKYVFYVKP